jgi:magnesium transporter
MFRAMPNGIRVVRLEDGQVRFGGPELAGPGAPLWVDLAPTPANLAFLRERFRFHPLALEDCANENQRVKFETYPEALFTVVHRIAPSPTDDDLLAFEVHAFLTADALVTVHSAPIAEIDALLERCRLEPGLLARGPDFTLYLVHDAITDVHFALVDAITAEIEEIADEVTGPAPDPELLPRIVAARRTHALLRRRLSPQREVFASLARPGQALVKDATAFYFRDVADHAVRLTEGVDMGRDLLASAMDAHLSQANVRLAKVTTRLTLIATIFLPLNFVAGFFGMNLEILPPHVAIPLVLSLVAITPVALWAWFRHERWL